MDQRTIWNMLEKKELNNHMKYVNKKSINFNMFICLDLLIYNLVLKLTVRLILENISYFNLGDQYFIIIYANGKFQHHTLI